MPPPWRPRSASRCWKARRRSKPLGPPAPRYLISRPALAGAGVGLVFATLYTAPALARRAMRTRYVYENAHEAHLMARSQVNYYRACDLQLIRDSKELERYVRGWRRGQVAAVLLMEGADPIETPGQLGAWTDMGLRIIGPAWRHALQRWHARPRRPHQAWGPAAEGNAAKARDPRPQPHGRPGGGGCLRSVARSHHRLAQQCARAGSGRPPDHRGHGGRDCAPRRHRRHQLLSEPSSF